jgi:hypothetical protein
MNAYDIEIEYDQENDNYYAEHEFSYPSKRVRLNIDTDNSLWPTDESNSMTITIPSNPQTDTNNTWDDTTKTLTLTNLDQNTLITNNQNPTFNYATDLNINLSNYKNIQVTKVNIGYFKYNLGNSNISFVYNNTQNYVNVSNVSGKDLIIINVYEDGYVIYYYYNYNSSSFNLSKNSYIGIFNSTNSGSQDEFRIYDIYNNEIMVLDPKSNTSDNDYDSYSFLYKRYFDLNLVNVSNYQ